MGFLLDSSDSKSVSQSVCQSFFIMCIQNISQTYVRPVNLSILFFGSGSVGLIEMTGLWYDMSERFHCTTME